MPEPKCQTNQIHSKKNRQKRSARVAAVQALYSLRHTESTPDKMIIDLLDLYQQQALGETIDKTDEATLIQIVRGASDRRDELVASISQHLLDSWRFERLPAVIQAILLSGSYEILHMNAPKAVAINEYVEIAKILGHEGESSFVNRILDRIQ